MEHDPRYVALLILTESSRTRLPLDTILDQFAPQLETLSKLDRSLANAIIYGTLRWQGTLDWIIEPFSDRRIEIVKTEVAYILRMAMFQIVFMDRIPVSAAVNTAVNMTKKVSHQGTAGFVNAVLRKASTYFKDIINSKEIADFRDITSFKNIVLPDPKAEPELYISVTKSMPLWLVRRWITRFGFDKTLRLCDTINTIPPITIRANTLKTDRDKLISMYSPDVENIAPTKHSPDGISFTKPSMPIHESEPFKYGFFQVQDEAAQLVTIMLNPLPGERILDACAGLGGKTGHIAQLMKNQGVIIACDTDLQKLVSLEKEMNRLGVDIVRTLCKDILKADSNDFCDVNSLSNLSKANESVDIKLSDNSLLFDKVLVDAPCSGMGVLRRNPDAKWKRTKKDLARLAIRQEKMLLNSANLVKPGGTLFYAVCSCETRENEDVVESFLKQRPDFVVKKEFRTYPDSIEMDGFFAALMERQIKFPTAS
ncbi:MAG: 16S rRNA (cytosine(967)-C(5))-methyltransferase RsmB [Desulfamplus sp.]|nr:16S rRNA (cytosine(967)-C(5))-methyltransferase RsmB [Desulfamplus sp.]